MNKKLIISLSTIVAVIAIGVTFSYFSNTEKSEGNAFIAGAIDLKVDNECHWNGRVCQLDESSGKYFWEGTSEECFCTWDPTDLDGQLFFNFNDIKPGDDGEDTISLHVDTNPAWVCAEISNITSKDNGCNPPELKAETAEYGVENETCDDLTENEGELIDNLYFSVWMDDNCDNIFQTEEGPYLVEDANATNAEWPIADSQTGGVPIQDACIGISWYVPDAVGNIIQSDSVKGDITFNAYQGRNNDGFLCFPPENGTLTVIKHVINDDELGEGDIDKQASDFTINVTGVNPNPTSFYGEENGTIVTLGAGVYSVSEDPAPGYTTTFEGDCSGTIAAGESKTCTVINDDEGCFEQADVMLVLDRSASIDTGERNQLKAAAHSFVTAMNPDGGVHMGQSSFADTGSLDLHLTGNQTAIHAAIDALAGGTYTNLYEGLDYANTELDDLNPDGHERPLVKDYMIVITDGNPNRPPDDTNARTLAANEADAARTAGVEIYVVGVGGDVDSTYLINNIADDAAHYFAIANYEDLEAALMNIAYCGNPPMGTLTVVKEVTNDNNGQKQVSDFGLFVGNTQVTSGAANDFLVGSYVVSENNSSGYTATFSGDCDANGNVTITEGANLTCTITNDDVAIQTLFTDGFGTGSTDSIFDEAPAWIESNAGAEKRAAGSGDDSASPNGDRFAIMFGDDGRICTQINTSAYNNVNMSYYWRGDNDAEDGETGVVQYRIGSCSGTSGWTTVASHELDDGNTGNTSWVQNTGVSLPSNSTLAIRLRVYSSQNDEHFRVDGIVITGIPN